MKVSKTLACAAAMSMWMIVADASAQAGIPVFDSGSLAQAIKQFQQMQQQFQQMQQQYNSMNGSRGMASLVNNPALRQYLPADYQTILNGGYGNSGAIRQASKIYGIENTTIGRNTDTARAFEASANQAAINRATAEEGYRQASQRFASIQVLLDKVNQAPDAKDIADLQARIQAEQVMLQNESIKLQMLAQLQQAQRDLAAQQAAEIGMKSSRGPMPKGW
ncbi:MAG: hypothetical protein RIR70_589 [Pseudomonadota bacterium]